MVGGITIWMNGECPTNALERRHAGGRDAVRDERERQIGLVGDDDRLPQRRQPRVYAGPIAREHRRQRLGVLHDVSRLDRDHEADRRVDRIVHARAAAA
jgi:hypothetical protein